jgi:dUTP pyrophosphatase
MKETPVAVQKLANGAALQLPAYATIGSAGLDLQAAIEAAIELAPGERRLVPTGIAIALEPGYEAQVRPRSGLALKHGVTVLNSPGTIDADYRGEIGVILINHGQASVAITPGMRIAQLVIAEVVRASWRQMGTLSKSDRGAGGFGSTGA